MIIYKITNKLDGKTYIGQTKKTVAQRLKAHIYQRSKIGKEIIKLGLNSFDISVIDSAQNQEDLDALEVFWISFYNACENGYNTLKGGKPTKKEFKLLNFMRQGKRRKKSKSKEHKQKVQEARKETIHEKTYKKYMRYFGDRIALPFPKNGEFSKNRLTIIPAIWIIP